jgi:multidrug efflux pump subunit AcrB
MAAAAPPPGPGGLLSYFTRHRTLANLLMVLMLAAGFAAATQMRAQFFPDVVVSEVDVTVRWDGAGAEDIDRAIVAVLEPAILALDGVTDVSSRATEGRAGLSVEFEPGHDLDRAVDEIQSAIELAGGLPEGAEAPEVRRGAWRDQVTDVVISGPVGVDQLGRFADELVLRLFAEGVTRTTIRGIADPRIVIEVEPVALMRHDVTLQDIAAAVAAAVDSAPAGDVSQGAARVRTGSAARSAEAIAAVPLRAAPDGTSLRVGDVAAVRAEPPDRGRAAFVGDDPAVTLRVDRSESGDAIGLQASVQAVVDAMQQALPPGVTMDLIRTRSELISARLDLLVDNGIMGIAGVLALLFLFLNASTAFWVACSIPVAAIAGLAVMHMLGLTLNMISIFGILLILGVLVDDSIIVAEHAVFRARNMGEHPVVAAERAARRMAMPVFASTITTVIAFAGLVAIGGRFGEMIRDIPLTVIALLLVSLVECFLILPHHMAHALAARARDRWYDAPSRVVNRGFDWVAQRLVRPMVGMVVQARLAVVAGFLFLLATQVAALMRGDVVFQFFNAPEQSSVTGNFAMLPGATRDDTLAMMRELQRATEAVAARLAAEHGTNPVEFALAEVGGGIGRGLASADTRDADLQGGIAIELIEPDFRPYSSFAFIEALQAEARPHPLMEELSFRGARFGPGGDAISVDLYGADTATLKAAAEAVKAELAAFPDVLGVEDTLAYDKDELVLTLTPQGEALGFSIDTLGATLRGALNGIEAATYPDGPRTASVRVELPEAERTADFLERLQMRVGPGQYVPLADIVAVRTQSGFAAIRRENGLRTVTVSGDIAGDDADRTAAVQAALAGSILPGIEERFGVAYEISGLSAQEDEFLGGALTGFVLCLLGIYLALAWVFASWSRPMVVMSVIPFGLVSAVWGHDLWDTPMSMFSIVGLIGMAGIVINDSIVLISTTDEYRVRMDIRRAVTDAVVDRLKPVFLTTATTVIGFAPLLYETSSQALFLKPTIITLAYGLGFGAFVVLILVPAILVIQADIGRAATALRRMLRPRGHRAPGRATVVAAAAGIVALFAATLGAVAATGALPGWIAARLPDGAGTIPAALGVFAAGSVGLVMLAAMAGAAARLAARRRA